MQYRVLFDETASDLESSVDVLINQGWVPQGGVSLSVYVSNGRHGEEVTYVFAQAMTYSGE